MVDGPSTAVPAWGISMNGSEECYVSAVKLAEDKKAPGPRRRLDEV